jgi:hypothetical protein
MRDRNRILREWDLDKQCMHMLSPAAASHKWTMACITRNAVSA